MKSVPFAVFGSIVSKIALDTYTQARKQDKRKAQLRIVKGLCRPRNTAKNPLVSNAEAASTLKRKPA